ncbi:MULTISPECIES: DUF6011 domain-containing protein [Amycolatopsis]|uniref:DUF6011 domain-containing protein n=1 Tax=Amycolatopsis albidoflavus TaxID=102226 RepID=A0ABW5I5A0_9PSEU
MTNRCQVPTCNRPLTSEESRRRGMGPVCWRRHNPAAPRIPAAERTVNPDQIPLPLEEPVDAETAHSLVDRLVDTDPLKLRDALFAVISKLEALDGRSAVTDEVLDEIRAALQSQLA